MNLKTNAIQYALCHGLNLENLCLITGLTREGSLVTMSLKEGVATWKADRNFDLDGGLYTDIASAQAALSQSQSRTQIIEPNVVLVSALVVERYKVAIVIEREIVGRDGHFYKPDGDEGNSWSLLATVPDVHTAEQIVTQLHQKADELITFNKGDGFDKLK